MAKIHYVKNATGLTLCGRRWARSVQGTTTESGVTCWTCRSTLDDPIKRITSGLPTLALPPKTP